MPIKSLSQSSLTNFQKYSSFLAGNTKVSYNAYDLLATELLTGNQASITFSNLSNYTNYQHLQIRLTGRSDEAGSSNARDLRIRANGDIGNNYSSHRLRAGGTSAYSEGFSSQNAIIGFVLFPRPSNPTDQYGAAVIDILDFSSNSKYTTFRWFGGTRPDGESAIALGSGTWLNSNPVTSVTIFANSGNLATGGRASLYGIKAA